MKIYSLTLCLFLSIHLLGQNYITVTNTNDAGEGSLREAMSISAEGDHIVFDTSLGGDTVFLDSAISIFNSVSIHGRNTILSAKNASRIFFADGLNSISMDSLTLTDAFAEENGGAIQFTNMGDIRLSNVVIKNNLVNGECGAAGGGVYIEDSEFLRLYNTTISNNKGTLENGGGCIAAYGGGVFLSDVQNVEVVNSSFQDNQIRNLSDAYMNSPNTGAKGGGLYINGGTGLILIENTEFKGNLCYVSEEPYRWGRADGGGLFLRNYGKAIVRNSQFLYNTCESHKMGAYAGGANLFSRSLEVANNVFLGNFVTTESFSYNNTDASGGGAIVDAITDCWVHHNTFKSNVVIGWDIGSAGGLNAHAGRVEDNIIETNTVQAFSTAAGGGLGVSSSNESFVVKNNIIRQNNCSQREGGNPDVFLALGVGIYSSCLDITLFGNQIYSNQFSDGGTGLGAYGRVFGVGMYCRSYSNSKAVLRNNLIFQNLAYLDVNREGHYSGLYLDVNYQSNVEIRNNSFYFNQTIIEEEASGVNVYCKVSRESKLKLVGNIIEDTFPENVKDIELILDDSELESGYNIISSNVGVEQFFDVGTPNVDYNYVGDANNRFYSLSSAIRNNQTNEMNLFVASNSPIVDKGDPNDFSSDYREFSIEGVRDIGAYEVGSPGMASMQIKGNNNPIAAEQIQFASNTGQVQFLGQRDSVVQEYWIYNSGIGDLFIDSVTSKVGFHNSQSKLVTSTCSSISLDDSCRFSIMFNTDSLFFGDTLNVTVHTSFIDPFVFPVILELQDSLAPVAIAKDTTLYLNDAAFATLTISELDNGSFDNSNWILFDTNTVFYNCENVGNNEQVFVVNDFVGNRNSVTVQVTVLDSTRPEISTGVFPVYLDKDGEVSINRSMWEPFISDNCLVDSVVFERSNFTEDDLGLSFVSTTAWDGSLNSSTYNMKVLVVDSLVHMKCIDREVQLKNGLAEIDSLYFENGTISYGHGIRSIEISKSKFDCYDLGEQSITITVSLVNGFQYFCAATLTVLPEVLSLPESCLGYNDGTLIIPCGQNTNTTFSLDGITYQSNAAFNNLTSGVYDIYMKTNGRTYLIPNSTIESADPFSLELAVTDVLCNDSSNGSLLAEGVGMHLPIYYSLNGDEFDTNNWFSDLDPGNYSLLVKEANGCLYDTTFLVKEPAKMEIGYSVTPEREGGDGSIAISVTGGTLPIKFGLWDFELDSLVLGVLNLGQNLSAGSYTIGAIDNNGCLDTVTVIVDNEVSLEELGLTDVVLYPNPSAGLVHVNVKGHKSIERLEVCNTIGEILIRKQQLNELVVIDFSGQAKGVYFVKIFTASGVLIEPLILQ